MNDELLNSDSLESVTMTRKQFKAALAGAVAEALAQRPAAEKAGGLSDTRRLDWLQDQLADTIYMDDGRIIDVGGKHQGNLRAAIDASLPPHSPTAADAGGLSDCGNLVGYVSASDLQRLSAGDANMTVMQSAVGQANVPIYLAARPTATADAVAQDEREAFEAWYRRSNPRISDWRCTENLGKDANGLYFMQPVPRLWAAWQAASAARPTAVMAAVQSPYAAALDALLCEKAVLPRLTEEPLETWAFRCLLECIEKADRQPAMGAGSLPLMEDQERARFAAWVKEDRIPNIQRKHHWKTWLRALSRLSQDDHIINRQPASGAVGGAE